MGNYDDLEGGRGGVVMAMVMMVASVVVVMVFNLEKAGSQDKARVCRSIFEAGARSE